MQNTAKAWTSSSLLVREKLSASPASPTSTPSCIAQTPRSGRCPTAPMALTPFLAWVRLVYCGLQGWWSVLKDIIKQNDLGHPMCSHLRDGQWALDYIVGRMDKLAEREIYANLKTPAAWLRTRFDAIRKLPSFILPRYFALVIRTAHKAAFERGIEQMNHSIQDGQWFLKKLAMVSAQMPRLHGQCVSLAEQTRSISCGWSTSLCSRLGQMLGPRHHDCHAWLAIVYWPIR